MGQYAKRPRHKNLDNITRDEAKLIRKLRNNNISATEADAAIKSGSSGHKPYAPRKVEIGDKKFSYLYFSDPHFGHEEFKPEIFDKMLKLTKEYKPDFAVNAGDTLEGMSGRPGHIYELSHIGFQQQSKYAVDYLKEVPVKIFAIDGNHDEWYQKKNNGGILVGEELGYRLNNWEYLGQMEGNLNVDGIDIQLYHGADGTSYADSYKLQKLIESYSGSMKPHIVHSGHYHKHLAMHRRNIFGVESGTLMGQSRYMRGKKIPAHMGFGFVTVYHDGKGSLDRVVHEFVPHYEKGKRRNYTQVNLPKKK